MKLIALALLFLERLLNLAEGDPPSLVAKHSGNGRWVVSNSETELPIHQGTFDKETAQAVADGGEIPEENLLTDEQKAEQAEDLAKRAEAAESEKRAQAEQAKGDQGDQSLPQAGATGTGAQNPPIKAPNNPPKETGGEDGPKNIVKSAISKFGGGDVGEVLRIATTHRTGRKITITTKGYVTAAGQFVPRERSRPEFQAEHWGNS